MQVILLEKVANVGDLGTLVDVKAGFGRNFLIPKGKAVRATKDNIAQVEARRAELEQKAAEGLSAAHVRAEKLAELEVTVTAKSGDEGKLFGSVGNRDLAAAITEAGVDVAKSEVQLPTGPLRQTGEFDISVQLHTEVVATVKVTVIPAE